MSSDPSLAENLDNDLTSLVERLSFRLGRIPAEDEIMMFIYGSELDQLRIWNSGQSHAERC